MTNGNEMYMVVSDYEYADYVVERDVSRMDRKNTISDVMSAQFGHIKKIIAFDLVAGKSRDATKDIAQAVADRCNENLSAPSLSVFNFIDGNGAAVLPVLEAA
jgi:hypothetical protein